MTQGSGWLSLMPDGFGMFYGYPPGCSGQSDMLVNIGQLVLPTLLIHITESNELWVCCVGERYIGVYSSKSEACQKAEQYINEYYTERHR